MITAEALPARDLAVWGMFVDWCAATGHDELPAGPAAFAGFLAAHPAAPATQRRRIAVVHAVHRAAGALPPGRTEVVRELADARRAERLRRTAHQVVNAIDALPTAGWPTLLFARRDAALLVLASTGISFAALAGLRIGQVSDAGGDAEIAVGADVFQTGQELHLRGVDPAAHLSDWLQIRGLQQHAPSTRALAGHIRGEVRYRTAPPTPDLPLFTPLDRWGAAPLRDTALSARAVSDIVAGHLRGTAPVHHPITVTGAAATASAPTPPTTPAPALDSGSFGRGIAARRRAEESLADVTDILDEVADRADRIMEDLLALLEEV